MSWAKETSKFSTIFANLLLRSLKSSLILSLSKEKMALGLLSIVYDKYPSGLQNS
jgi:hypothetical protein